jgi:hypothetical protein
MSSVALSTLTRQRLKRGAIYLGGALTLTIILLSNWFYRLNRQMNERLAEGRFAPAVEFYAAPERIRAGFTLPPHHLETFFKRRRFSERGFGKSIEPGEFSVWTGHECRSVLPPLPLDPPPEPASPETTQSNTAVALEPSNAPNALPAGVPAEVGKCVAFANLKPLPNGDGMGDGTGDAIGSEPVQIVVFRADKKTVLATFTGAPPVAAAQVVLEPEMFAQYYGDRPILREVVPLANAPGLWVDAIIDPAQTREALIWALEAASLNPEVREFKTGVLQT